MFSTDELLEGIFGGQADPSFGFKAFNGAGLDGVCLMHDGILHAGDASYSLRLPNLTMLEVGKVWSLYFDMLPAFERGWQSKLPLFVLPDGLTEALTPSRRF